MDSELIISLLTHYSKVCILLSGVLTGLKSNCQYSLFSYCVYYVIYHYIYCMSMKCGTNVDGDWDSWGRTWKKL